MTMAKNETRTPESVLAAIEDDLRRDELIWRQVHRDLRSLGVRRPRRTGRLMAAALGVLVLVAASFVVGRTTASEPAPARAAAVAGAATTFTATGLESKREGLVARYGSPWGWGPRWNESPGATEPRVCRVPLPDLDAKSQGFVARFGRTWACGQL